MEDLCVRISFPERISLAQYRRELVREVLDYTVSLATKNWSVGLGDFFSRNKKSIQPKTDAGFISQVGEALLCFA